MALLKIRPARAEPVRREDKIPMKKENDRKDVCGGRSKLEHMLKLEAFATALSNFFLFL